MKIHLTIFFIIIVSYIAVGQTRTVHVYVALCDNKYQGIVPVPASIGNGKDPANNLYWGAAFGLKTYFEYKTTDWQFIETIKSENPFVLERILFKHISNEVYLLADAYDGEQIKSCIEDFLKASSGNIPLEVSYNSLQLNFGGKSDLVAYVGHDGLMDFNVYIDYNLTTENKKDVIILACYSKKFFSSEIKKANASPVLWTTHLMAPEAYTLNAALDGWILFESGTEIEERAAQAYNKYQKCGINGARNLFTAGF